MQRLGSFMWFPPFHSRSALMLTVDGFVTKSRAPYDFVALGFGAEEAFRVPR